MNPKMVLQQTAGKVSYPGVETSPHCLDRCEQRDRTRPPDLAAPEKSRKWPDRVLTFANAAARAIDQGVATAVVLANFDPALPSAPMRKDVLITLTEHALAAAPIRRGGSLGELAFRQGVELSVGLFSGFFAVGCTTYCFQFFPTARLLRVSRYRARRIESSVHLPNNSPVGGIYLGCVAVAGDEIVRGYFYPAWTSDDGAMGLVRSGGESIMLAAAHHRGLVLITPTHEGQYGIWQQALGFRWRGDLTSLPFVADALSIPPCSVRMIIRDVELYGVRGICKYRVRKAEKDMIVADLEARGLVGYWPIVAAGAKREEIILGRIEELAESIRAQRLRGAA